MTQKIHTLIIGAGIAGLSAARELHSQGMNDFVILEATDKAGGRVRTCEMQAGSGKSVTLDEGMHWIHSDNTGLPNPLTEIFQGPSFHDTMARHVYKSGQRKRIIPIEQQTQRARTLITRHQSEPISIGDLAAREGLTNHSSLEATFGVAETGEDITRTSVQEAGLVPRLMGDIPKGGMIQLTKQLMRGLQTNQLYYNQPVSRIEYYANRPMCVTTQSGEVYKADNIIITASVGVLKTGAIVFDPPLPESHQQALNHMHMVDFNKVMLTLDEEYQLPENHNTHLDVTTREGHEIFYQVKDGNQPAIVAYLGGDLGRLAEENPERATQIVIDGLKEIWPDIKLIDRAHVTRWGHEPYIKGAYSITDIGHFDAREALAQPIDGRVFFAGEACRTIEHETGRNWATHGAGAYLSGRAAARAVLSAMPPSANENRHLQR